MDLNKVIVKAAYAEPRFDNFPRELILTSPMGANNAHIYVVRAN